MKRLQLDYAPYSTRQRNVVGGIALTVCLLVGFWLLTEQRDLHERISQYKTQSGDHVSSYAGRRVAITSDERQAGEAAHALNMPWDKMLGALEQVQTVSSGVHLLTVQPNPVKGEVQLGGEAEDFSALMDYMKALRAKSQFVEVVLVNQRLASESSQTKLVFTLLAHWKIE